MNLAAVGYGYYGTKKCFFLSRIGISTIDIVVLNVVDNGRYWLE